MALSMSIEFDAWDPAIKYYGGDTIRGSVVVINKGMSNKTLSEDLTIKFMGKAETHWKEQRRNVDHYRQYLTTTFDSEIYFEETIVLLSKDSSGESPSIGPGKSEFSFQFTLPMGIPESFTSEHGSVGYWAELPFPPKALSLTTHTKHEFKVGAHLDLNCCPRTWIQPAQFTMCKSIWWGAGKVECQLSLPYRTFVPLDNINFTLEVTNHSRCYLKKIRVYFCQVTLYKAKGSEYKDGVRLSKLKCKPVFPRGTATIQGSIAVPEVPPTELGGCELIQPQYGIMVKVIATSFGNLLQTAVLEGRVPILVGTVPFGQTIPQRSAITEATLTRPITALRQNIEFTSRRVVLTEDDELMTDQFTNLSVE